DGRVALALAFASGAGGSLQVSCGSFLGSGHRIELYGEDGALVLSNPTADYFRGFELSFAREGDDALKTIAAEDADAEPFSDSRISPVRRLVERLIAACENGVSPTPLVAAE